MNPQGKGKIEWTGAIFPQREFPRESMKTITRAGKAKDGLSKYVGTPPCQSAGFSSFPCLAPDSLNLDKEHKE